MNVHQTDNLSSTRDAEICHLILSYLKNQLKLIRIKSWNIGRKFCLLIKIKDHN